MCSLAPAFDCECPCLFAGCARAAGELLRGPAGGAVPGGAGADSPCIGCSCQVCGYSMCYVADRGGWAGSRWGLAAVAYRSLWLHHARQRVVLLAKARSANWVSKCTVCRRTSPTWWTSQAVQLPVNVLQCDGKLNWLYVCCRRTCPTWWTSPSRCCRRSEKVAQRGGCLTGRLPDADASPQCGSLCLHSGGILRQVVNAEP